MKYAALFAFVAFAFLAQANARSLYVNGSVDRGAIADALKAKLAAAKEKLNKFLDTASEKLKAKIAEAQKKAEQLIEQLKQKASKISDDVYIASEKLINKIEKFEDKYLSYFQNHATKPAEQKPQPTTVSTVESFTESTAESLTESL